MYKNLFERAEKIKKNVSKFSVVVQQKRQHNRNDISNSPNQQKINCLN